MASVNVPGIHNWGNLHSLWVLGATGLSPCHGGSLRAPFLFSHEVADMMAPTTPRAWTFLFFPRLVQQDVPSKSRFLGRPRLLTRV